MALDNSDDSVTLATGARDQTQSECRTIIYHVWGTAKGPQAQIELQLYAFNPIQMDFPWVYVEIGNNFSIRGAYPGSKKKKTTNPCQTVA